MGFRGEGGEEIERERERERERDMKMRGVRSIRNASTVG